MYIYIYHDIYISDGYFLGLASSKEFEMHHIAAQHGHQLRVLHLQQFMIVKKNSREARRDVTPSPIN